MMLVSMPILMAAVFLWSEASLRRWLGDKLDRDVVEAVREVHLPALCADRRLSRSHPVGRDRYPTREAKGAPDVK